MTTEKRSIMRTIPSALQAKLDSGVTTLCRCWIVTRRDGVVLGFTDHDEMSCSTTSTLPRRHRPRRAPRRAQQLGLAVQGWSCPARCRTTR